MNKLIDNEIVRRNPAVDARLLETVRRQVAEIDRLKGAQERGGYRLVEPLDTSSWRRLDNPKPPYPLSNQPLYSPARTQRPLDDQEC